MINLIAIVDNDTDMFVTLEDGAVILTNDIQEILTFKNVEDAKTFAKQMLDDYTCYDVVNVEISIKTETIDAINY